MKKTLIFSLIFLMVLTIFSCKNEKAVEIQKSNFDISLLNKLGNIQGNYLFGYTWNDEGGTNHLIFTKSVKFVQYINEEPGMGDDFATLNAYHFAGKDDKYILLQHISDGNEHGCSNPPFLLDADFHKESVTLSDIDKDGFVEICFMYKILCASEIAPVPTKLVFLHKNVKYQITGTSYIAEFKDGSQKINDDSFARLPVDMQNHANQIWDKFCK